MQTSESTHHLPPLIDHWIRQTITAGGGYSAERVPGGSINRTVRLRMTDGRNFFLKYNSAMSLPGLFESEASGLKLLSSISGVNTASILQCCIVGDWQLLLLEWIDMDKGTDDKWSALGRTMALVHDRRADAFGLDADNYIGSLPQRNTRSDQWNDFFIEYRLTPQLQLAVTANLAGKRQLRAVEKLRTRLPNIFGQPAPRLVHGDLWHGNVIPASGKMYLIDPSIYFGHPAMDIGMAQLFGGFGRRFHESYRYYSPPATNFEEQCRVAQLYPLLVHLNLFGGGYLDALNDILDPYD